MKKHHWALLALLVNLTQSLLKLMAGILTGSLSLTGEAFHSFSDSFVSFVALFTIALSERKSSRFPYGLYKLENISAITIGIFLLLVAYEVSKRAFTTQVVIKEEYLNVGMAVVVFSMVTSLALSLLERNAGKKLNSPALIADSYHTLTDVFASSLVLASLFSAHLGYQLDRYFAIGVCVFITYTAFDILKREISILLDISVESKTLEEIKNTILSFDQVQEIRNLYVRSSGGKLFADITLSIQARDFADAHRLVDKIEEELKRRFPNIEATFIHYEPVNVSTKIAILLDEENRVAGSFLNARKAVIFQEGEKARMLDLTDSGEEEISQRLSDKGVNIIVSGCHPESAQAKAILSKEGIFVWETQETNPHKVLSEIAYNLTDVKNSHKESTDHRPFSESR